MIADVHVVETGEAILMDLETAVTARVAGHLEQFVFSEDVEVADASGLDGATRRLRSASR